DGGAGRVGGPQAYGVLARRRRHAEAEACRRLKLTTKPLTLGLAGLMGGPGRRTPLRTDEVRGGG
ncbi:hypothetical protein, partial [Streptomyces sp. NPDC005970]|uniref:hypothetical protein n=1 Tax=Streptomyces sp. NPDC005970 TaxID=3156723 RepID=UPI0033D3560E